MRLLTLNLLVLYLFCCTACDMNTKKQEVQETSSEASIVEVKEQKKYKRLDSEVAISAINDTIHKLYREVLTNINFENGELMINPTKLVWDSEQYDNMFWIHAEFDLKVDTQVVGNSLFYFTSCIKPHTPINIFGFIQLEKDKDKYELKDSCFNITRGGFFRDTWAYDYSIHCRKDSLPILIFNVGQGEATVAYSETIALFDIKDKRIIGDTIYTQKSCDEIDDFPSFQWDSDIIFSVDSFNSNYPDFILKTKGTEVKEKKKVEYNNELVYKYDTINLKYKKVE